MRANGRLPDIQIDTEPSVPPGRDNSENYVDSVTQRVQPIFRLPNAAYKRLAIEFLRLADIALRAKGSPSRQDGRVIRLR